MESALSKRIEDLDEEQLSRIYMNVFTTDEGKLVLEDLKNRCHFDISTVTEHTAVDPFQVVFKEGRRSTLLHIMTQLQPREAEETKEETNA